MHTCTVRGEVIATLVADLPCELACRYVIWVIFYVIDMVVVEFRSHPLSTPKLLAGLVICAHCGQYHIQA